MFFTIYTFSASAVYQDQCIQSWKNHHGDNVVVKSIDDHDPLRCQALFDAVRDPQGKRNILKWELLAKHGGMCVDPDVFLVHPLDHEFLLPCEQHSFVCYRHESAVPGLLSSSVVKFQAGDRILHRMIEIMQSYDISRINEADTWQTLGDGLLTRVYHELSNVRKNVYVLPSFLFSPFYAEKGIVFNGHCKVYGVHVHDHASLSSEEFAAESGEGEGDDDIPRVIDRFIDTNLDLENDDHAWCQVMIVGGENPSSSLVASCLESIMMQHGALLFGIEVIWIDDPRTTVANRQILEKHLHTFSARSRNCVARLYRPTFPMSSPSALQAAMERVFRLFPERDLILQFFAQGVVNSMRTNFMFLAEKMQEVILEEDEEDENKKKKN